MSSYGYTVHADPEGGFLDIAIDYYVDPYTDPETGEYFDGTNYSYNVDAPDGNDFGGGGSGSDSGGDYISLYIFDLGPGVFEYGLFFRAENWFSAESIEFDVTILVAAYQPFPQSLDGGSGDDIILAGKFDDIVSGHDGNDYLLGGRRPDTLDGGAGNDTLDGGLGADALVGGEGDDRYYIQSAGDTAVEQDGDGYDTVFSHVSHRLAPNIEALLLLSAPGPTNGTGNASANTITGNLSANRLSGLGGADRLIGNGGGDRMLGGGGQDTLVGAFDADTMKGGRGNDTYDFVLAGDRTVEKPDEGIDTIIYRLTGDYRLGANIENITVSASFVLDPYARITGNALDNAITTTRGADTLRGGDGDDTLSGLAGDDRFLAGAGRDRVIGGDGFDTLDYSAATAAMRIDLAGGGAGGLAEGDRYETLERVIAGAGADSLFGDDNANVLDGRAGDDSLRGRGGNDLLLGGAGADALDGGEGFDRASFANALGALVVDLTASTVAGPGSDGDTIARIEGVIGGAGDDAMSGDALANLLAGGGGADSLAGLDGNDTLGGGAGADSLDGGDGIDVVSFAGSLGGVLIRIAGQSVAGGDADGDVLTGFEGAFGGEGKDTIVGDGGDNDLRGGAGRDKLRGGSGDDTISGGAGADALDGGDGIDTLSFADARTGVYVDLQFGVSPDGDVFANFENLEGGRGHDGLYGDTGANRIRGGAGFDYLFGAGGDDTLTGGRDGDIFASSFNDGHDVIADFETDALWVDQLEILRGFTFNTAEEILAVAEAAGPNGEHTLFRFDEDHTVLLLDVLVSELNASHFYFYEDEFAPPFQG